MYTSVYVSFIYLIFYNNNYLALLFNYNRSILKLMTRTLHKTTNKTAKVKLISHDNMLLVHSQGPEKTYLKQN